MSVTAYAFFHLNLDYSSIAEGQRPEVIERAYRPLLELIEGSGVPFGVELPGGTLRRIAELAPGWLERFRALLDAGRCELIGSGHVQLIGPLAPPAVNAWNQRLGLVDYQELLGRRPELALVNEMAYSPAMADLYHEHGYRGLIMDRDNVRLALGENQSLPGLARGGRGRVLPVLWADSILFQKFQRYVHGDITRREYLTYLHRRAAGERRPLALYGNDVEIFDYRPGRYAEEAALHRDGEWRRLAELLEVLAREGVQWLSPSAALAELARDGDDGPLCSVAQPVPVKKQAKYNLSRWAVTGRNDLWLNTLGHRLGRALENAGRDDPETWRRLCRLWSSDLRTHITEGRWRAAQAEVAELAERLGVECGFAEPPAPPEAGAGYGPFRLCWDEERLHLEVDGPGIRVTLNRRRGLAIGRLAFARHGFVPLAGTLEHGHFDQIELGADFYSGNLVLELPGEHRRITDLEWCDPQIGWDGRRLAIQARIETAKGAIVKRFTLTPGVEALELEIHLPGWRRPHGSLRIGALTLLGAAFTGELHIAAHNGGPGLEEYPLDRPCDHTAPASALVSCRAGFGATGGRLELGDGQRGVALEWDPAQCAAFPLLLHRPAQPHPLTRLFLSLAELDETSRPEGEIPPLRFSYLPLPAAPQERS